MLNAQSRTQTVATQIANWIGKVTPVAGVSGANIEDLFFSLWMTREKDTRNLILSRHESGACSLADAYARASGKTGFVLATSGGGALNLVPGIAEAFASRIPLLAIVGQPPVSTLGTGAFQETSGTAGTFSIEETFRSCAKKVLRLDSPENIIVVLDQALAVTQSHPKGPVVVLASKSVLSAAAVSQQPNGICSDAKITVPKSYDRLLKRILQPGLRLSFIFGGDFARESLSQDSRDQIRNLMKNLNATWTTTLEAKAIGDFSDEGYLGMSGVIGHPEASPLLKNSDLVIVVGTRLGAIDRFGVEPILAPGKAIYIHTEPAFEPSKWFNDEDVFLVNRFQDVVTAISDAAQIHGQSSKEKRNPSDFRSSENKSPPALPLVLSDLAPAFSSLIRERAMNVVADAGNAVTAFVLDIPRPRGDGQFLICMGMGGMGYSFGAGIGAHLANQLPTLIFAGDGAFAMNGAEFQVVAERKLPVLLVLADNHGHAMCTTREKIYFGADTHFNDFSATNLSEGLKGLYPGVPVHTARSRDELKRAIQRIGSFSSPQILVLALSHDETPPFQPFQMAMNPEVKK